MNYIRYILQIAFVLSMVFTKSIHANPELPNRSIRPAEQLGTVSISAEALYWYTSETVDWAFTLKYDGDSVQTEYKTFVFDWAPGFRVGHGYNMEYDQWDTQVSYTWFQSKATDHASGAVTAAFLAARLSLLEPFTTGKASLNLKYNMFDWDLGRSFLVSNYLCIRPAIGLKGDGSINPFTQFGQSLIFSAPIYLSLEKI